LDRLLAKTIPGVEIEICLVESNSTDGTREEVMHYANHPRIQLVLESKPSGKGHAVRAGLVAATGDFVLIQDADLEYDLGDYEKLLAPLLDGRAEFVLGSRHPAGEKVWQLRQFSDQQTAAHIMNVGHLIFAWMLNVTFGQKMRDPFTMFKVFRRDAIHNVAFECNRFDFDLELVGKLIRQGYRPREIDIKYNSRSFKEGKKVSALRDPPTWVRACLKHRFSNLHVWPGKT
jgi:glycosyltransferase involved in cell wall biosynthesis